MVDSLAKNVDKYITQLDNMASVCLLPSLSQANLQSPSMHSGSDVQEDGNIMFNRGDSRYINRGFNRQASNRFGGQRGGKRTFQKQYARNSQNSKCEYCYMQSRGRGQNLDYNHDISNCPQMISKFSRINLATAGDQESDQDTDSDENKEFKDFYDESL